MRLLIDLISFVSELIVGLFSLMGLIAVGATALIYFLYNYRGHD